MTVQGDDDGIENNWKTWRGTDELRKTEGEREDQYKSTQKCIFKY